MVELALVRHGRSSSFPEFLITACLFCVIVLNPTFITQAFPGMSGPPHLPP